MPRRKIIPDTEVFALIRRLLAEGGDKAVAFGSVSRATGLAPSTLVQRFGSREAMVQAALGDLWDRLDAACIRAEAEAPMTAKGAASLLKALAAGVPGGEEDSAGAADLSFLVTQIREPNLRGRAATWRARVETALSLRLGGGDKGREIAAILFAAWMGQTLWQDAGGKGFRLKDALKRIT